MGDKNVTIAKTNLAYVLTRSKTQPENMFGFLAHEETRANGDLRSDGLEKTSCPPFIHKSSSFDRSHTRWLQHASMII